MFAIKRFFTACALLPALVALLFAQSSHATFFQEKAVTSSPWYTGTAGSAQIAPISTADWLSRHAGGESTPNLAYQGFVIEDPQLTALVYEVTNRLLQHWPGTVPSMVVYVQGEGSPTTYGAATTDAREVFLYYGVLTNAKSEDELAAVIAHELGHVLLDHVKTLDYAKKMRGSIDALSQAGELLSTVESTGFVQQSTSVNIDSKISEGLKQSANQRLLAHQLYDSAHATLFSRDNELEADRFAIDLLIASGYSAMGLKTSLERLSHSYDLSNAIATQLTSNSDKLMKDYSTALGSSAVQSAGSMDFTSMMTDSLKNVGGSALDVVQGEMLGWSAQSHPVTSERIEHFSNYLQQNYSRKERRQRENRNSAKRFHSGEIGTLLSNYRAANEAIVAIRLNDATAAKPLVSTATSGPTAKQAYPAYAAFELKSAGNAVTAADANGVEQYGLVPVPAAMLMADALVAAGDLDGAMATTAQAEARFGTVAAFYPVKIQTAKARGNQVEATQLAEACADAKDGNKQLADNCAQLAGVENSSAVEKINSAAEVGKSLFGGAKALLGQ
jgi:Zn-dependent protease with chaperone function